ncbi:MAG TPA: PQQ-binding-like beta-propeller repeat protein, partial [Chloroflexota bacterium]
WRQLNADATQSNYNATEKTLSTHTFLHLRVKWSVTTAPLSLSYPIVAGGRVYIPVLSGNHVYARALDVATGKPLKMYSRDTIGGMVYAGSALYLAGSSIQAIDPTTGQQLGQIVANPKVPGGVFIKPVTDGKTLVVGYAGTKQGSINKIYAIDATSNEVRWQAASLNAETAIASSRVLTQVPTGSTFYDEASGKVVARENNMYSDWFAGPLLNYTVATVKTGPATLYAVDGSGKRIWSRVVGPRYITAGWPHAIAPAGIIMQTLQPRVGVEELDPESGNVIWFRPLPNIAHIAVANGVVYVLTYGLGQPIRLYGFGAGKGKPLGVHILSQGFYGFASDNALMVANGMVFVRAVDSRGNSYLVALGT